MKLDILAFGAHPDDVELSCAGTLAKEVSLGKTIGLVDLTRGELGTRGTAAIRKQEATDAAKVLGAKVREQLDLGDGTFEINMDTITACIRVLRKYRPEVVFANAIEDRHPDHARGSELVSRACFMAGLEKIETEWEGEKQTKWRPKAVYHYIQWKDLKPDLILDISGHMDTKIASVAAYKSQFYDPDSKEDSTPISSKNFMDSIKYRAANLGRLIGTDHAEGFTVERTPAVDRVWDLI